MSVITKNEAKDLRKLWKEDDEENIEAIKEARFWSPCQDLLKLFCVLLEFYYHKSTKRMECYLENTITR